MLWCIQCRYINFKAVSLPRNKQAFSNRSAHPDRKRLWECGVFEQKYSTYSLQEDPHDVVGSLPLCKHINLLVPWRWEPAALIDCRKIRGQSPGNINIYKLDPSNESNQPRG